MIDAAPATKGATDRANGTAVLLVLSVLAVAFQIQVTPSLFGTPVRLSLSDLISPALLGFIAWDCRQQRWPPPVPAWRPPRLWLWLLAMTGAITLSLVVGRIAIGHWFPWAVVSKFAGWFALLWYFLLAGWAVSRLGDTARRGFIDTLVLSCAAIAALDILARALRLANVDLPAALPLGSLRLQGLMENPNAFAYLAGMALLFWLFRQGGRRPFLYHAVIVVLLAAIVMAASRGLWLALLLALPVAVWLAPDRPRVLRALLVAAPLAAALVVLVSAMPTIEKTLDKARGDRLYPDAGAIVVVPPAALSHDRAAGRDPDLAFRVESNLAALRLWWDKPLLGQGLGYFLWSTGGEQREDGFRPTLHNSLLWILAEMGLVGGLSFVGFFVLCLRSLWPGRGKQAERDPLRGAGFVMLILFAGMSLSTEIIYQRHFWFLLGLLLALAPAERLRNNSLPPA